VSAARSPDGDRPAPGLRRLRLSGADDVRARALDVLHVRAEVRGVEERDGECEVWLEGAAPDLLHLAGLAVDELPITAAMFAHTGREHDAPLLVAADLCVRPPWVERPMDFAGIDLVVPRGSAFGSGEHASTRAALLGLHGAWPESVTTFLDVGTGSGILALYARARGVPCIVACDLDPSAARAAAALLPSALVYAGEAAALAARAEVVVANLTAAELERARAAIVARWTRRGTLVLSGLRGDAEVEACRRACARDGLAPSDRQTVAEFTALVFTAGSAAAGRW